MSKGAVEAGRAVDNQGVERKGGRESAEQAMQGALTKRAVMEESDGVP